MVKLKKQFFKSLGLLAALVLLNGCMTLGPDYEEPTAEWLDSWQSSLYEQTGSPDEQFQKELRNWWQLFDDPVLDNLIELARRENASLRIAGLRILESRASLGIADSNRYPQVQQATGAINYVNTEQSDGPDESKGTYAAGFNLGWELDFWGRFKRGMEAADAVYFASVSNYQDAQVLLFAQVADLYFAHRTTLLRIAIAKKNAEIQKRSFEITELVFRSGEESELDLQQAKTQYMATLSTIPGLEISEVKIRNALCALLGRAPGDLPELDGTLQLLPEMSSIVIKDIPAQLLMRRPDIRASAWQVAVQSAQIGIAKTDLYPSITLLGNIGLSGSTVSGSSETLSLSVGPALSWNLFNYGRIKNNVRVQDARLQQTI